ncbi:3201_t:CDS:2, partial [Funneliformis geosporum]
VKEREVETKAKQKIINNLEEKRTRRSIQGKANNHYRIRKENQKS